MRYGIIRDASFLPPPARQRALLESAGCDVIVQERGASREAAQRIDRLLQGLKASDAVVVQSPVVLLKSTGDLTKALRDLLSRGASVIVTTSETEINHVQPSPAAIQALSLLADHESLKPGPPAARARGRIGGGSRNPLSPYQIDYARKLHGDGASLRAIGLLFQLSPEDVGRLIGR